MSKLTYHVATTIDGYIARADGSAPGFAIAGPHVDDYQMSLAGYGAVVMGRATYEVGYAYGMKPGALPYGPKPHYVFSGTMAVPESKHLTVVRGDTLGAIDAIKASATADVYLCGGGRFAGFLLGHDRIDRLLLKVSPIVYGNGIRVFEGHDGLKGFTLSAVKSYPSGVVLLDYARA